MRQDVDFSCTFNPIHNRVNPKTYQRSQGKPITTRDITTIRNQEEIGQGSNPNQHIKNG